MDLSVSALRQIASFSAKEDDIDILVEGILYSKRYDDQTADRRFSNLIRPTRNADKSVSKEILYQAYRSLVLQDMFCDAICFGTLQKTFGLVSGNRQLLYFTLLLYFMI